MVSVPPLLPALPKVALVEHWWNNRHQENGEGNVSQSK